MDGSFLIIFSKCGCGTHLQEHDTVLQEKDIQLNVLHSPILSTKIQCQLAIVNKSQLCQVDIPGK